VAKRFPILNQGSNNPRPQNGQNKILAVCFASNFEPDTTLSASQDLQNWHFEIIVRQVRIQLTTQG